MKQICILSGDYPDPTILREGDTYYMTHSSFLYRPGLIIFKSKDLLHWERVSCVFTEDIGDVWAPDLVKFEGRYYIYLPVFADGESQIYVTSSDSLEKGWSKPEKVGVKSFIDPGFYNDGEQNWLYFNGGMATKISSDAKRALGDAEKCWEPWDFPKDWVTEGHYAESPKLFKKDGNDYLIVADGGTAGPPTSHMAVCYRRDRANKEWKLSPYNPVIHTYSEDEKWWSTGHASYVEDPDGNGYFVYHGYLNDNRNIGRQTLLCRAQWTDDGYPTAAPIELEEPKTPDFTDSFDSSELDLNWAFFRKYETDRFSVGNGLKLYARGDKIGNSMPMTVNIGFINSSMEVTVSDASDGCAVGIAYFYNENANLGIYARNGRVFVSYMDEEYDFCECGKGMILRIEKQDQEVQLSYSSDGNEYIKFEKSFSVKHLEHNNFGGFLALRPAIVCFGSGNAEISKFTYKSLDK